MTDLLSRQDAHIHRCTCGAWVYRVALCPLCTGLSTGFVVTVAIPPHDGAMEAAS